MTTETKDRPSIVKRVREWAAERLTYEPDAASEDLLHEARERWPHAGFDIMSPKVWNEVYAVPAKRLADAAIERFAGQAGVGSRGNGTGELPLAQIVVTDLNPRKHFDQAALQELADSIAEDGQHQAILVRPLEPEDGEPRYELVAGERRLRAHELLGRETIEAKVREMDAATAARVRLTENIQRQGLSELEEAAALQRLRDEHDVAAEELAELIGKSASYVYQRLKLLELSDPVKDALAAGEITAGHAIEMARLTPALQEQALEATVRKGWQGTTTISVRDLRQWIRKNAHLSLEEAPWNKDDPDLVPEAGSCAACPKRTGNAAALWPDVEDGATCTDPDCFTAKRRAFIEARAAELEEAGETFVRISEEIWSVGRHQAGNDAFPTITTDTLGRHSYTLADDEPCDHAGKALVVDGGRAGEVVTACWEPSCDVHGRSNAGGEDPAAARRREALSAWRQEHGRRAARERRALADALVSKAPGGLGPMGILRAAIVRLFPEVWADRQKGVLEALGVEGEGLKGLADWCDEHESGALWRGLLTLALSAPVSGKSDPHELLGDAGPDRYRLEPLVEAAGLDLGALRASARADSSAVLPRDVFGLEPEWIRATAEGDDEERSVGLNRAVCHVTKLEDGEFIEGRTRCGLELEEWKRVQVDNVVPDGYQAGRYIRPCERCLDSLIAAVQTSAEEGD